MTDREPTSPPPEGAPTSDGRIRWVWMGLSALVMGAVALGSVLLVREAGLLAHVTSTEAAFWYFELGTGGGYLAAALGLALVSPGRTVREPLTAALLAFAGQSAVLWYKGFLALNASAFLVLLAINAGLAYLGAWAGEEILIRTHVRTRHPEP